MREAVYERQRGEQTGTELSEMREEGKRSKSMQAKQPRLRKGSIGRKANKKQKKLSALKYE